MYRFQASKTRKLEICVSSYPEIGQRQSKGQHDYELADDTLGRECAHSDQKCPPDRRQQHVEHIKPKRQDKEERGDEHYQIYPIEFLSKFEGGQNCERQ